MAARLHFDEQLLQLNSELGKMSALISRSLKGTAYALATHNIQKARWVIDADEQINRKERDIETLCIKLLLQQQPVARDLRIISAALKMITDMERIGDQAADICGIIVNCKEPLKDGQQGRLPELVEQTNEQVNGAITAFLQRDLDLARLIMAGDDQVNQLFRIVRTELIELIRTRDDVSEMTLDLLMIAKYYERIGDHAQNIAEWVEYSLTGYYKGEVLG